MRGTIALLGCVVLAAGLFSCTNPGKQLESGLTYDPLYKELRAEDEAFVKARSQEEALERTSPDLMAEVEPLVPEFNPLDETTVSISVQEETIHNILYIVARNAGLNLVIEPGISLDNRVTISFEDASSGLVVEKLMQAYDLAWEVRDNILYVQRWNEEIFDLDFVNSTVTATTASGGDIFGSALSGGGGGSLSGTFTMDNDIGGDFDEDSLYGKIMDSVKSIIEEEDQLAGGGGGGTGDAETNGYTALDPVAGRLYVRSTPGKLRAIAKMLNNLRAKLSRQVIIDARFLEVRLSDNYTLGVDWNWVSTRVAHSELGGDAGAELSFLGRGADMAAATNTNMVMSLTGLKKGDDSVNAIIEAMQTFGGVKAVANPHVRAKHGQPALFTTGTSSTYVSEISSTTDDNGNVTYTVATATVFDGVMLGVMPFISDDGKVDLQIYPIQSVVDGNSLNLQDVTAGGDKITLPRVDVKNVSTTVRVNDGDVIILGGLLDKGASKTDEGIPGLQSIPVLGWLFKGRTVTDEVRELVIIMSIKVVK